MPAKAVDQAASLLTGRTPSLASQLPQGFVVWSELYRLPEHRMFTWKPPVARGTSSTNGISEPPRNPVGAGLPAKAVDQAASLLTGRTPSLASQLLQGFVVWSELYRLPEHLRRRRIRRADHRMFTWKPPVARGTSSTNGISEPPRNPVAVSYTHLTLPTN